MISVSRMDKYEDEIQDEPILSRTRRNQDMYKDVYLNNTLIDMQKIVPNVLVEENEEVSVTPKVQYEEKSYDINDYLIKAHERRVDDNLKRSLDDTDCEVSKVKDKQDEISKLIESIEQKEKEEDFFSDLLPDNEDTVITDPIKEEEKLENFIDEDMLANFEGDDSLEEKIDADDFMDIEKPRKPRKVKQLPLFICILSFLLLVLVVILIFLLQ